MPKPMRGPRLGGSASHQKHIISNLAKELIRHGRIKTTLKKAKTLQPHIERMVTWAKQGDISARRRTIAKLRDKDLAKHLFTEIGPKNADREGGYTRVVKIGPRKGDNAMMAVIEFTETVAPFVDEKNAVTTEQTTESSGRIWGRRKKSDEVEDEAVVETDSDDAEEADDADDSKDVAEEKEAESDDDK